MLLDDIRKTLEATFSNLSPSKAQELAKGLMEPGAAKDQIAKMVAGQSGAAHHVHPRRDPEPDADDGCGDALGPGFGEEAGP